MQKQHAMMEHQLQQLWQDKRLPFHLFKLTNGSPVGIIRTGFWNLAGSGPDFQMAEIEYDDLRWFGSIEFHLKSSDWYKHQHHIDQSYHNVILHVVHEHDQEVFVKNRPLPTLELKSYLSGEFRIPNHYEWMKTTRFPCKKQLHEVLPAFQQMQHLAIQTRLQRKFKQAFDNSSENESIYRLISAAFGTKTNSLSFEILAQQIPLIWHKQKSTSELMEIIQSNEQGWKSKNRALQNNMMKRVRAWIRFVKWYFYEEHPLLTKRHKHLKDGFQQSGISNGLLQRNIQINAMTYLEMRLYQHKKEKVSGLQRGINYLRRIPSEQHRITRVWDKLGIRSKNALESQANLEIYQQFCAKNKCLHCCVGQQLLKP